MRTMQNAIDGLMGINTNARVITNLQPKAILTHVAATQKQSIHQ